MNKTLLIAALAALVAAPGSAKELDMESLFNLKIAGALGEMQAQNPVQDSMKVKRINAISRVLLAMNDGVEIGGQVVAAVKDKGILIDIRKQAATSESVNTAIFISDAVSLYPRALAPLIARETAKIMLADMPVCAEKHYMARSIEVRSWIELGGDKTRLPVIEPLDGYTDAALSADFKLWTENKSEMALYRIGQATGTKDLMEMESGVQAQLAKLKPGDPARAKLEKTYAELEAANKRFVAFLLAENDWRQMYP
jgi:hypothetical protein